MKIGVNTFLWGVHFGPADFHRLAGIKEGGFDGIEFAVLDPKNLPATAIRRELERAGLEATAVSVVPAGMHIGSSDAAVRARTREHLTACIRQTAEAGATILSGPMYSPVGYLTGVRRTADEWKWGVETWQALAPVAADAGVEIGIEPLNRFETYFLNTAADGAKFCDAVGHPSIGLLFDTFHANIEEKTVGEALRAAAPHLKHLHTCENDRGTPGTGHVAWREFFTTLRSIGYDRWMVIESFGFALGELSAAAAIWRDLAPTVDSIAFDGVKFLRAQLAAK
ncbi:MAG TPA: sugar phosphate isomerase/epimerase family protein [Vicinamibacterales bacterium]|nr:sugar phosphate isomerase/epimerase family protein [Vicinamibacterales bacterium]